MEVNVNVLCDSFKEFKNKTTKFVSEIRRKVDQSVIEGNKTKTDEI